MDSPACLPDDALVDVFCRLPFKCLHRSKCVCKRWRDIIADPLHRKILPQTLVGFFSTTYPEDGTLSWHEFVDLLGTPATAAPPPLLDPTFAFLDELPAGIECSLRLIADSCNGLLLFEYGELELPESLGYIVFNPATEQRVLVPGIWTARATRCLSVKAFLLFDPAVSSHFRIIMFWEEEVGLITVHAYSSETRAWSHSEKDWSAEEQHRPTEAWRGCFGAFTCLYAGRSVFLDGLLYVHMAMLMAHGYEIHEMDAEGKTQSIIPAPPSRVGRHYSRVLFFGQSQGRMHCIIHGYEYGYAGCDLSIWVIEDHGTTATKQWVLKHTVSCVKLFGKRCHSDEYNVFSIHPDCNTLFIVNSYKRKFISYDVDSDRVRDLCTFDHRYVSLSAYVPCFLKLLSN